MLAYLRHLKLKTKSFVIFFSLKLIRFSISCFIYRFPSKLRSMCHCLFQVVNQRFQQSTVEAVWTVIGTVIFLRFINPAIGITIFMIDVVTKPCIVLVFSFSHLFLILCFVHAFSNHTEFIFLWPGCGHPM